MGHLLSSVFSLLENRFGAKNLFLVAILLSTTSAGATLMVTSHENLARLYVLIGLGGNVMRIFGLSLFMGLTNPEKTTRLAPYMLCFSAGASLVVSTFFYFIKDWRTFAQFQTGLGIASFTFVFFNLTDPPLWLEQRNR